MPRYPELQTPEWLLQKYWVEYKTIPEMAEELGCYIQAIMQAMSRHGIERRSSGESRRLRDTPITPRYPELESKAWLFQKYHTEQMTVEQIASFLNCGGQTVTRALRKHNIPRRMPRSDAEGRCRSDAIRELHDPDWLRCEYLEKGRTATDIALTLGCSNLTVNSMLSRWGIRKRQGRYSDGELRSRKKDGYVQIWMPNHPMAKGNGFMYEHRLVVEKALGRYLLSNEVVHHLNEKRDDNRLDNLLVFDDHRKHKSFHENPPDWVPRCECCGQPRPELLDKRPDDVPLYYEG